VFQTIPRNTFFLAFVTADYAADTAPWNNEHREVQELRSALYNNRLSVLSNGECIKQHTNLDNAIPDVVVVAKNVTMDMRRASGASNYSSLLFASDGDH
jgi:hypothetical protein